MAIWNLGSINIDHVYRVPHLPRPGETLAADGFTSGLGGKGANQSVAAARAGARVFHIGSVGADGDATLQLLQRYGVDTSYITESETATGHAIINVDREGENAIVVFPGANRRVSDADAARALASARPSDHLLMQNETSAQQATARLACDMGLVMLYSAAPFDIVALRAVLPYASLLLMNEGEAKALRQAQGALPENDLIITQGAKGAEWISATSEPLFVSAFAANPVDTTGAGDCFAGNIAAALDAGLARDQAMRRASAAAALQVTRPGAAKAMPTLAEIEALLMS